MPKHIWFPSVGNAPKTLNSAIYWVKPKTQRTFFRLLVACNIENFHKIYKFCASVVFHGLFLVLSYEFYINKKRFFYREGANRTTVCLKRASLYASRMVQHMVWHIKFLIFDFLCAFDRSSFETKNPKFSAHLNVL